MEKNFSKKLIQSFVLFFVFSYFFVINLRSVCAWDFEDGFFPDFGSSWWRDPRQFFYQIIPPSVDWGTIAGWFFLALLIIVGAILLIVYMLRKPNPPIAPPPFYPPQPMVMNTPPPFVGPTFMVTHANGFRQSVPMMYDRMMIGRNSMCQIVLQDFKSSDQHAEVFMQGGRYFVRDLGSSNGTLVNGYPINGTVEIFTGSYIQVGDSTIQM